MPRKPLEDLALMDFSDPALFLEGQILLVDKPLGWTSFDVVNKIRYHLRHALGIKKIKVGHAGTLDPLATGVLVVCTGQATKSIEELQSDSKTYEAVIRLGSTIPCLDTELPAEHWTSAEHIQLEDIITAAVQWTGSFDQMPPLYSAKKIKGQKAYAVARKGGEINLKAAPISVNQFDIREATHNLVDGHQIVDTKATIDCSKGTYIRALARDLGKSLRVGGHLIALQRTRSGPYSLDQCQSLDAILEAIPPVAPTPSDSSVAL